MDNVTHTLFALTLARTRLGRGGRDATLALVLASNAPDIDILSTAHTAVSYLRWHRGPTHGLLGVVGLGLLTAALVWTGRRLLRGSASDRRISFVRLATISILAVAFHVLMDLPTSYGTRPLSPFDWHWFAEDWMPIVDMYLLVALAAGLYFGRDSDAARRRNVAIVLVLMAANYGIRAAAHHEALALAPRLFGPTLPAPCEGRSPQRSMMDRWPRDTPLTLPPPGAMRCLVEIAALPALDSPFRWRVIAQMSNAYEVQDVNLLDRRFRVPPSESDVFWRLSARYPNQWTPAVFRAASTSVGQAFLGFSRFPAARSTVDRTGAATVLFIDMRFLADRPQPGVSSAFGRGSGRGVPPRPVTLFSASIRFDADGRLLEEHLGP